MMKLCKRVVATIFIVALCAWAEGVTRMTPAKPVVNSKGAIPIDGRPKSITGKMKIPVILVNHKDVKFSEGNDSAFYDHLFNKENFNEPPFYGSVHDYYRDQSNGKLDVTFDILGVLESDINQGDCLDEFGYIDEDCGNEIVAMIVNHFKNVDYSSYDWNEDGFVDALGIITAGVGLGKNFYLHEPLVKGGVSISGVFHVGELDRENRIHHFGTICHEFAHVLGLVDLYEPFHSVLGDYDLMDKAGYLGNGYRPAGYSAYEKWQCGWQTPIELTKDTLIESLKPQSENGDAFWIVNPNNPNEAFFIENRQKTGWDTDIPENGLMITHLNYDSTAWASLYPNTDHPKTKIGVYYVMANGKNDALQPGVLYPYNGNDSLTAYSLPDWQWVVGPGDGRNYVNGAIVDIRQNEDGTLSFNFKVRDNSDLIVNEFEVAVDGLWYHVDTKKQTAELIPSKGDAYAGEIVVPSSLVIGGKTYAVSRSAEAVFSKSAVTSVVLPEGMTIIPREMFDRAKSLKYVKIPQSVTTIGINAFNETSSLTEISFPDGLLTIEENAFVGSGITKLTLPPKLKTIKSDAFLGMPIRSVEIPASVERIGIDAFYEENLDTVVVRNNTPIALDTENYGESVYTAFGPSTLLSKILLRVPKGSLEAYKKADIWKLFGTIEEYETDSPEEHTTVVARRIPRYDLKMDGRFYDLRGRQLKGRPKHKGFFVER